MPPGLLHIWMPALIPAAATPRLPPLILPRRPAAGPAPAAGAAGAAAGGTGVAVGMAAAGATAAAWAVAARPGAGFSRRQATPPARRATSRMTTAKRSG